MIELKNIDCGYGKKKVLNNVSLTIKAGEFTCLLGENGVGKTTLFKTILGLLPVLNGAINYDGKSHTKFSEKDFARFISYVPQAHNTPFPCNVLDVVLMGQFVHAGGYFKRPDTKNLAIAQWSIEMLGIEKLAYRNFSELSGGEKQMALIARAVAQQPKFIAMDEPTSNLDMGNQTRVMQVAGRLKDKGYGIIMNTHSPQHALQYADRVILLQNGKVKSSGSPSEVLNSNSISSLYATPLEVVDAYSGNGQKHKVLLTL